ncbi:MAG: hypothetical protein NVS9B1_07930 [Candidatus Dormibacteraceae bacterium]
MNPSRLLHTFPGRVYTKIGEDNGFNWAVIIAWNFLQSLFPIVLVMAALLGVVLGLVGVGSDVVERTVVSIIPDPGAQAQVLQALGTFHQRSGVFFVIGFAGLLWSGSNLFRSMEQAFAVIYHTRQRSLVRGILVSFAMILVFTVLAGLVVASSFLLGLIDTLPLPRSLHNGVLAFGIQLAIGAVAGFILFLVLYVVIPNRRMSWGKVWVGALVAGLLFEGLTLLFPLYIRLTGAGAAYGKTFGLLFLLMAFFYFLGLVTMIGVEINSLRFAVPIEQPDGPASLQSPIQGRPSGYASTAPSDTDVRREAHRERTPPARPRLPAAEPAAEPGRRPSRVKAILGLVVLGASGALRSRRIV